MYWFKSKRIYMDYAAATPVRREAQSAYEDASRVFGNPGGLHSEGMAAAELLEKARKEIAHVFQCRSEEIYFTSGGTEGNNLAVLGSVASLPPAEIHIVTTLIEHPSILEPIKKLEKKGASVTFLVPDEHGEIYPESVRKALTQKTTFVSIGWANSEMGVIQPLHAITDVVRAYEKENNTHIIFHTDMGQAPLYLKSTVHGLGVDVATADSGKLYGPRGVGALFIRRGVSIAPIMFGGGQEGGVRPGTENTALAAGFASALTACAEEREEESKRLTKLQEHFKSILKKSIPGIAVNGEGAKHVLPHIVNISIPDTDAEYIALALDHEGVAVSTKTSCREGERESAVVAALGTEPWRARNTLRFSFGRETTLTEVDTTMLILNKRLSTPLNSKN